MFKKSFVFKFSFNIALLVPLTALALEDSDLTQSRESRKSSFVKTVCSNLSPVSAKGAQRQWDEYKEVFFQVIECTERLKGLQSQALNGNPLAASEFMYAYLNGECGKKKNTSKGLELKAALIRTGYKDLVQEPSQK